MTDEKTLNPAIHAAFRRDLDRFDQALGVFQRGDGNRADQLAVAWDQLSYQLHRHHQDEESFFWPAFDDLGVDTDIIASLQGEHDEMVSALDAADQAMVDYGSEPTAENARMARLAIEGLNRILCDHLAHEEHELDPFSIATKRTKEHKAAERAARKAHTEGAGRFFAWLIDGCDAESGRIIRREVPAPILWLLTHTSGRQYNRSIASIWS